MEDIDMRPGVELFPEAQNNLDMGQAVVDPLNTGAVNQPEVAAQLSEQQLNFRALREEVARMKEEREYWKGQADAYSKIPVRQEPTQQDVLSALDWDDSKDVKKAFDAIRSENVRLREEIKDALTAIETKTQRQDWNKMVTQHVPQLTSTNPIFAEMIQKVSNPYEAAYLLAELNAKATQNQNVGQSQNNGQRAIANANKPQTLASIGGQGQLSSADYYASMSDEDFMKIAARNLANI